MLMTTRLGGFSAVRPLPRVRFVGQFDMVISASTTGTVTVNDSDLDPGETSRQILVFAPADIQLPASVTIDGVQASNLAFVTAGEFVTAWSAPYSGDGPFNVVVTMASSGSSNTGVLVFEVFNAAPLHHCEGAGLAVNGTSIALNTVRIPRDGLAIACAMSLTDTHTFTWSSLTEVFEGDVGDCAMAAAVRTTNATEIPGTDLTETVTVSASATVAAFVLTVAPAGGAIGGRIVQEVSDTGIGPTHTITAGRNRYDNMGVGRLIFVTEVEADSLPLTVTYDGVSMNLITSILNTGAAPDLELRIFELEVDLTATPDGSFVISGTSLGIPFHWSSWVLFNASRVGDFQTVQGNATGAALALDVENGGFIIGTTIRSTDTQTVTWTGINERRDTDFGPGRVAYGWRAQNAAEQNRVVQAVGSGSGQYATLAVAFNP